jgi:nucleolar protein 56
LANKCSIASRIDCFTDSPSTAFGQALRGQVEERLAFYETGANPTKNKVAMEAVLEKMKAAEEELKSSTTQESAKPKKRKSTVLDGTDLADPAEGTDKKKKKKKRKVRSSCESYET